ncbi:hypothetical protein B0T17DRAFT_516894 [Bombardia bombarda]|uniref:rRNA biogenesis protein RRP36 n=1 Tax=Bombardia bombarda TaxID=252184 RepID=A0AA40CFL8_9PEZI|nr:hypothetical protein B0T17DRAFT_516894 [Bombardia bombarda]
MSSVKRKMPSSLGSGLLQRRVRPRVEPEPESDVENSDEAPSEQGVDSDGPVSGSGSESDGDDKDEGNETGSEADSDEASSDEEEDGTGADQLSFGALARAQAQMSKKGQPGEDEPGAVPEKERGHGGLADGRRDWRAEREREKLLKRSSKHAPVEMTSKKPVTRRRDFIAVPSVQARDPRFLAVGVTTKIDEVKARKAYAFLDDYQEDEMKQLKDTIKKTKDPVAKEKLQRTLMSMESKKKARVRKEREEKLIEEHRRQEKELVKQGKQPFYLKKSEQKKRLLVDQFASMKKGQVDKAIERKRKKVAGKEKKSLPFARRTAEERE